jgi:hypothetical protein
VIALFKFAVAVAVGLVYACAHGKCWGRVSGFFRSVSEGRVDEDTRKVRINLCKLCDIYYAPLGTCGSPLHRFPELGCHCFVEIKAGQQTNCWICDHTEGARSGWGRLDSFPFKRHE